MKAVRLLLTVTVILANNLLGAESALPLILEPEEPRPLERNLSMRYLEERNLSMRYLSMRYLGERNLSMRYLAVMKSDSWGRGASETEKTKLHQMAEDSASLWERRNLSMRYLREGRMAGAKRLRVARVET
jgi:hypothetical protein